MRKTSLVIIFAFVFVNLFAQQPEIFMTIDDSKITTDEFIHIYKKNNSDNINNESLDEYLTLFKNFKLKVVEAQNLKLDTSEAFKNELRGYKDQLAKPYLSENIKYDELIKEAYERNKTELKLDIIFLKLSKYASPEDTTLTYEKAIKIRDRILAGENFEKVATETSDDRLVSQNKGHLNYLPSIRIPYKIQEYAFKAKKGTYSFPIKTTYGYYIIKLVDTRDAQGIYKVSHIMISSNDQMSEEEKKIRKERADSIYKRILAGDKFEDLVKHSDDKGTAKRGGELPEFSTGRMVPEFEKVAFGLNKPGEISKPVKTRFGWHIIKLLEKKQPETFDEQKDQIQKTVKNDSERREIVQNFVFNKLKKEYKLNKLKDPEIFYSIVDTTIFEGKWILPKDLKLNSSLFTVNGKIYKERSFGEFLESKQKRSGKSEITSYVNKMYEEYIYSCLSDTEKNDLINRYPEYRYITQEYHDGMLIFDLMKNEVWDKASNDSIGLHKFYKENKEEYSNQTELDISVFKYKDEKTYSNAVKLLKKDRKKYNDDELVKTVNSKHKDALIKTESGFFAKGESIYADKVFKLINDEEITGNKKILNFEKEKTFLYLNSKRISKEKSIDEIKGILIADYQKYLEDKWIEQLNKKYKIEINEKALKKIKESL